MLKCELCNGTGTQFHPGQTTTTPCRGCSDRGLEVDAVIAMARCSQTPYLAMACYLVYQYSGGNGMELLRLVNKRLEKK